ncbi:hypothetical protein DESC_290179 [Desulfosarcina cetonica]|nr:hypothetical protein DESC_290179 [Desulfosarcina cetonica]
MLTPELTRSCQITKGLQLVCCNPLCLLARPAGFEPATYGFVVRHSIQLSYGREKVGKPFKPKRDACQWANKIFC